MRAVVLGAGAVGARAARQLLSGGVEDLVVCDQEMRRAHEVALSLGVPTRSEPWDAADGEVADADVVVLTAPDDHAERARRALDAGTAVVSVADDVPTVRRLLTFDAEARERNVNVVVGAGFSPGLTCVLARHAAARFDVVDQVHVAKVGTGGPACAREHHRALAGEAVDWRDRIWAHRRGGSGRELSWFPDPIGAVDCYRAALPDALLLVPALPTVTRVTARMGANRRDRLTSRLPMLRRPHPEGMAGAVRVEVRGRRGQAHDVQVLGAMDRPAVAAGAVAAVAAAWAAEGRMLRPGAAGLAELVESVPFLNELARRGVRAAAFDGAAA